MQILPREDAERSVEVRWPSERDVPPNVDDLDRDRALPAFLEAHPEVRADSGLTGPVLADYARLCFDDEARRASLVGLR